MNFDQAFDELIGHEGGYSNRSTDPGGETMWGVTRKVAIQEGYQGSMRMLPRDTAKDIYRRKYWATVRADDLPAALRYPVFDAAVNSGPEQAVKWLQRQLGVEDDGKVGEETLAAAAGCNAVAVAACMLGDRLAFMADLPHWGGYGRGWARRIAALLLHLKEA